MQLSLGIHTHTHTHTHIYLLKSLGTYLLFTMLTSMVDYFVIFLVQRRETQARHEGTFI